MHKTNNKLLIFALLLLLAVAGIVFGISLGLQPGQSTLGIFIIIGFALVGVAAVISGINDAYDLLEKINSRTNRRSLHLPKKIAMDVLTELDALGDKGIEYDLFQSYLTRTYPKMDQEERTKIYEELETNGYIIWRSGFVKITKDGKKFINRNG